MDCFEEEPTATATDKPIAPAALSQNYKDIEALKSSLINKTAKHCRYEENEVTNGSTISQIINYYTVGEIYKYEDEMTLVNEKIFSSNNQIFTGENYYAWSINKTDGKMVDYENFSLVYTKEEGESSMIHPWSYIQTAETEGECKNLLINKDNISIFIPPSNRDFKSTADLYTEVKDATQETINTLCTVCLEKYTSYDEQLACYSIAGIMHSPTADEVKQSFDENCIKE